MSELIVVDEVERTCTACPAQWKGRTRDGRHVYVRYRWGWLQVGVGDTYDAAIEDDDTFGVRLGDEYHGFLEYDGLVRATRGRFCWPMGLNS